MQTRRRLMLYSGPVEVAVRSIGTRILVAHENVVVMPKQRRLGAKGKPRPDREYTVTRGTLLVPRWDNRKWPYYVRYQDVFSALAACAHMQNLGEGYPAELGELRVSRDVALDAIYRLGAWKALDGDERDTLKRMLISLGLTFAGDVDPMKVLARERLERAATLREGGIDSRQNIPATRARVAGARHNLAKRLAKVFAIDPRITARLLVLEVLREQHQQATLELWRCLRLLERSAFVTEPDTTLDAWHEAGELLVAAKNAVRKLEVEPWLSLRNRTLADLLHAERDHVFQRVAALRDRIDRCVCGVRTASAQICIANLATDFSLAIAGKRVTIVRDEISARLTVCRQKIVEKIHDEGLAAPLRARLLKAIDAALEQLTAGRNKEAVAALRAVGRRY